MPTDYQSMMYVSPMRRVAMDAVGAEVDARVRRALARGARGARMRPSREPSTEIAKVPERVEVRRVEEAPASEVLSPPKWARKFMPQLADKPQVTKQESAALANGYGMYLRQVQAERQGRSEERMAVSSERQAEGAERRHSEDLGFRREDLEFRRQQATQKAELSPQDRAYSLAFDAALARNPGNPTAALAEVATAMKGPTAGGSIDPMRTLAADAIAEKRGQGKTATAIREELMRQGKATAAGNLMRPETSERILYGETPGAAGFPGGLLDFTTPAAEGEDTKDRLSGWLKLKRYADQAGPGNPAMQAQLGQVLLSTRPSPAELAEAWQSGYFHAMVPEESGGIGEVLMGGARGARGQEAARLRAQRREERAKELLLEYAAQLDAVGVSED